MQNVPWVTHGTEICKLGSHKMSTLSLCITHGNEICMLVLHKMFSCSDFMQTFH